MWTHQQSSYTITPCSYRGGKHLTRVHKAKYLGGIISDKADPTEDITNLLGIAAKEFYKCKDVWDNQKLDQGWRLHIYEVKVASTLIYGMDTLTLSEAQLARLDYFNARCLRRIMAIPAAYISRVSNLTVFNRAARATNKKKYIPIGDKIRNRQYLLLGHIIRNESSSDHAKLSAIDENGRRVSIFNKRIGRPRSKWLTSVTDRIWKLLHDNGFQSYGLYYDEANEDHTITLYGAAYDRNGPFKKPRKPGKLRDYSSKGKKERSDKKKSKSGPGPPRGHHAPTSPGPPPPSPTSQGKNFTSFECEHLMSDLRKYFAALNMEPNRDLQQGDRADRHAARIHHPDKGGSSEEFRKIKNARDKIVETLKNYLMRHQRK